MTEQVLQATDTPVVEPVVTAPTSALGTASTATEEWSIPDKFKVSGEDGSINYEQSAKKLVESYTGLEKRLGTGDLPPKSVDEYKVEVADFDYEEFKADESNKAFLDEALSKGITSSQLNFLISTYNQRASELVVSANQIDTESVVSGLQTEWGKDYEKNMQLAYKASVAAGLSDSELNDPSIGNNPALIKLAAYYGRQLGEDNTPSAYATAGGTDIEALMKSPAYFDSKHPDHTRTKETVNAAYAKGFSLKR